MSDQYKEIINETRQDWLSGFRKETWKAVAMSGSSMFFPLLLALAGMIMFPDIWLWNIVIAFNLLSIAFFAVSTYRRRKDLEKSWERNFATD